MKKAPHSLPPNVRLRRISGYWSTLLDGLADIYLKHTGSSKHPYEPPHSVRSHFIRFSYAVLRPFFSPTEVSPKALSNRWSNLRKQHLTPQVYPWFLARLDKA